MVKAFRPDSLAETVSTETVSVASCVERGIAARTHLATALDLDSTTSERLYTADRGINSATRFTIRGEILRKTIKMEKPRKRNKHLSISVTSVLSFLLFSCLSSLQIRNRHKVQISKHRPVCSCCLYVLCVLSHSCCSMLLVSFIPFYFPNFHVHENVNKC